MRARASRRGEAALAGVVVAGLLAAAPLARGQEFLGEDDDPAPPAASSAPRRGAPKPARTSVDASRASYVRHVDVPEQNGMLRIPGGRFLMGTDEPAAPPNEKPARLVTVAPFWLDRTEVTVSAYRACVAAGVCEAPRRASARCTDGAGDPDLPVTCVPWASALAYCKHAKKRLPAEAEWELAARGTSEAKFPWGSGAPSCSLAVTLVRDTTAVSCSGAHPARVGSHPAGASVYGVLDLSGNVEEWTMDFYAESPAAGLPPRAGASHVLRGGGWQSPPSLSRATSRSWGSALEAGPNVGFRCARGV